MSVVLDEVAGRVPIIAGACAQTQTKRLLRVGMRWPTVSGFDDHGASGLGHDIDAHRDFFYESLQG